jgi:hypothetical protein
MTISEYRNKLLADAEKSKQPLDEGTQDLLDLAGDSNRIEGLIDVINDEGSSNEAKISAIDALNLVKVFSPVLPRRMPDFVNALRGQMNAAEEGIRLRAFSTLTSIADEVAQANLLADIASDKPENDKLLPTSTAISMLGRDQKALPAALLRKIAANPPTPAALVEAVRHMAGDHESFAVLKQILESDTSPMEARALIPEMINKVNPSVFLNTAKNLLEKGTNTELAVALTRGVAEVKQTDAKAEFDEAKQAVRKVMETSSDPFNDLANDLLFDNAEDSEK